MCCREWASKQEAAEMDFLPETGKKIAEAAIAAGLQVETAVRLIMQELKHELDEQGEFLL